MRRFITGRTYAPEGPGGGGNPPPPGNPPAAPPSEHPVAAPWAAVQQGPWTLGEGAAAKPWWHAVPEQPVRELMEAKQYANPAQLAVAYHNLNKLSNGAPDVVAIPGEKATDADWNTLYTKLGRPTDKAAYDFKVPAGVEVDPKMVDFGKDLFFQLGVPQSKAPAAVAKWNEFVASTQQAALQEEQRVNTEAITALETKWGPDLNANKEAGRRVIGALGLDVKLVDAVDKAIGTAAVVELLATIGAKTKEGKFIDTGNGGDQNNPDNMTKEQANAKITQLQGDVEFMKGYSDKSHPHHAENVKLMEKLYARS